MSRHAKHGIAQTRNWFISILFLVALVILSRSLIIAFGKVKTSKDNLEKIEEQYEQVYQRRDSIHSLLESFDDDFGFEKYVRENFGVVRPGEKIVVILNKKQESSDPSDSELGQEVEE